MDSKRPLTQRARVLAAVNDGCRNSEEVSVSTDLPMPIASSYLNQLAQAGEIVRTHYYYFKFLGGAGQRSHRYAPVSSRATPAQRPRETRIARAERAMKEGTDYDMLLDAGFSRNELYRARANLRRERERGVETG